MRQVYLVGFALVLTMSGVQGQLLGERTGINSLMGTGPSNADFVKEAALSDMFEMMSSELAAIRGDQRTRAFAAKMNEDHQKSSSELSITIKPHIDQTPLPDALDNAHQSKMGALKKLHGSAFDMRYFADQVAAHDDAVSLFERYAKSGSDDALKAFAQKMLPTLRAHLEMAKAAAR